MRYTGHLLGLAIAGTLLAGWPSPQAAAQDKPTLTIATALDPTSLDPDKFGGSSNDYLVHWNVFEGLYRMDEKGVLVPGLASCTPASDFLSYQCELRDGAKFHNGDPVTAADVVFSYQRSLDPATRNMRAGFISENIAGIDAVDARRFAIRMKHVDVTTLEKLSIYWQVKPKKYIEAVGNDEFARKPIGSGPFQYVDRRRNEYVELRAFEGYWGGPPKLGKIMIKVLPEEQIRLAQMMTGEVDVAFPVSSVLAARLKSVPNFNVLPDRTYQHVFVKLNRDNPETAKPAVREAILMAVNRAPIYKAVMFGFGAQEELWCIDGLQDGCDNSKLKPYPYDPQRARALLEKAGFDFSKTYRFLAPTPGRVPQSKEAAEAIAQDLQRVGIKTQLEILDQGSITAIHAGGGPGKQRDPTIFMIMAAAPDASRDLGYRLVTQIASSGFSSWTRDPELDKIIAGINAIPDPAKRTAEVTRALTIVHDGAWLLPLWSFDTVYLVAKSVDFKIPPGLPMPILWNVSKKG